MAFQEFLLDRYRLVLGPSAALQTSCVWPRPFNTNTTVLLLGESGTGKEVMARAITIGVHGWSLRFVA